MAQWTQKGFATISDSSLGMPLVHGFQMTQWEAEREMKEIQELGDRAAGTLLKEAISTVRVVPAELVFDDSKDSKAG